jgi:hypothetical protein
MEIFSWHLFQGLGSNVFYSSFRQDSILNKQYFFKKIAFLVKKNGQNGQITKFQWPFEAQNLKKINQNS